MDSKIFRGALEAYHSIYNEDLREEIQFENWVNSLVQEGYDLSEYTWEDMYEIYVSEDLIGDVWRNRGKIGSAIQSVNTKATNAANRLGAGVASYASSLANPFRGRNQSAQQSGMYGRYAPPQTQVKPTTKPAVKPTTTPGGSATLNALNKPGVQNKFIQDKPTSTATRTPAAPTKPGLGGGVTTVPGRAPATPAAKPAPTATSKPPVGSGYKKDTSVTDMIGRSQIRQGAPINTGNKSSDIRSMAMRGTASGGLPTSPTSKPAPARPMGSRKPGSIVSGLDMFDLVKGHLLDEGYADTEEAAIKIMANMSEEWRESILDEASRRDEFTRAAIARSSGRKGGITFEPGPNWDASANRGKGAHLSPKQKEKQRRKALRQEN